MFVAHFIEKESTMSAGVILIIIFFSAYTILVPLGFGYVYDFVEGLSHTRPNTARSLFIAAVVYSVSLIGAYVASNGLTIR